MLARRGLLMLYSTLVVAIPTLVMGQDYPQRPIQLVHGFGAGGNADTIARIIAAPLAEALGKPVVVEPKTGAGGNIASDYVAKARPEGYALVLLTGGHAVSAGLYRSLPFDPVEDFAMVSTVAFFPFVIAVRQDHAFRSLADLLAAAKAKPGAVSYSSVGIGSTQHLTGELLASMAGVEMTHVPYRGGMAPLTDLLSGQIDVMVDSLTVTAPQIEAGKIRGLGATSPARWPSLPDVPAAAETVPGFDVRSWVGIATTRGTPPAVVERLNREIRAVLALPQVKGRLETMGNEVRGGTPEEMRIHVTAEVAKWRQVIRTANVPLQ
jgi:tripartite-type tricarboxylate transporter receptor subunit TctC